MQNLLKKFTHQTLRIYTVSGVESYLGIVVEVDEEHVALRSYFKEDTTYINLKHIESFKVEEMERR